MDLGPETERFQTWDFERRWMSSVPRCADRMAQLDPQKEFRSLTSNISWQVGRAGSVSLDALLPVAVRKVFTGDSKDWLAAL